GMRVSHQYEPQRPALGQCQSREFHEDPEMRGGVSQPVSRSGTGTGVDRRVYQRSVQRPAAALGLAIPVSGTVRSGTDSTTSKTGRGFLSEAIVMSFLRHEEIYRSDVGVLGWGGAGRPYGC